MYVDNKEKGTSTIKCNAKGCGKSFTGKNHGEAWRKAKAAGWSTPNAAEAWCNDHKPARATKKAAVTAKSKKAAAKATGKKKMVATRKPGNVVSYTSAPDEG